MIQAIQNTVKIPQIQHVVVQQTLSVPQNHFNERTVNVQWSHTGADQPGDPLDQTPAQPSFFRIFWHSEGLDPEEGSFDENYQTPVVDRL